MYYHQNVFYSCLCLLIFCSNDADPHTLAEYIASTLEGIEDPMSADGRQELHDALSEVLNEHTESFIDDLCKQMDGKSFITQNKDEGYSSISQADGTSEANADDNGSLNDGTKLKKEESGYMTSAIVKEETYYRSQKRTYRDSQGDSEHSYRTQKQPRTHHSDNAPTHTEPLLKEPRFPMPPPSVPFPASNAMAMIKPMPGVLLSGAYSTVPPPLMTMQPSFMGGFVSPHSMYGAPIPPLPNNPLLSSNPISPPVRNSIEAQAQTQASSTLERSSSGHVLIPHVSTDNADVSNAVASGSTTTSHTGHHTPGFSNVFAQSSRPKFQESHHNTNVPRADSKGKTLRISGLPTDACTVPALSQLFANYGSITSVVVANGEGFVQFATHEDAVSAQQQVQPALSTRDVQVILVTQDGDDKSARSGAYAGSRTSRGGHTHDKRGNRPPLAPRVTPKPVPVTRKETPLEAATRVLKEKDVDAAMVKDMIEKQKALLEEIKNDRTKGIAAAEIRKKMDTLKALVQRIKEKQDSLLSAVKTAERAVKSHQDKAALKAKLQQERETKGSHANGGPEQKDTHGSLHTAPDADGSPQGSTVSAEAGVEGSGSEDEVEFSLGDAADY